MPRRVGLPGASELFRPTSSEPDQAPEARPGQRRTPGKPAEPAAHDELRATPSTPVTPVTPASPSTPAEPSTRTRRRAEPGPLEHTGRVRHDEKITIYVSSEELLALERLRLDLRAEHGLAVDRGRIVRAAIASALAAIDADGTGADVLRRLAASP